MSSPRPAGAETWPAGVLTVGVGVCVVIADQVAKAWALASLSPPTGAQDILGGWFRLVLITNKGAAFGLLGGSGLLFVVADLALAPRFALRSAPEYNPDFVNPPPSSPLVEFEDELGVMVATPPRQIAAEVRYA